MRQHVCVCGGGAGFYTTLPSHGPGPGPGPGPGHTHAVLGAQAQDTSSSGAPHTPEHPTIPPQFRPPQNTLTHTHRHHALTVPPPPTPTPRPTHCYSPAHLTCYTATAPLTSHRYTAPGPAARGPVVTVWRAPAPAWPHSAGPYACHSCLAAKGLPPASGAGQ